MVEEKIAKMSPRQLLAAFDMFDESEMKSRLMTATIKGLKAYKLDIRLFDSTQLSRLIALVTQYQPSELSTFYKYVDQASSSGLMSNFEALASLFYLFVEQGFVKSDSKFYFTTQLAMKQQFFGEKGISSKQIVDLTWALVVLEGQKLRNPLIPKALEALS